jgi:hypothetical protein
LRKPRTVLPWFHGQASLLPPSSRDWLPADHQVSFLLDLVAELDLTIVIPARGKGTTRPRLVRLAASGG